MNQDDFNEAERRSKLRMQVIYEGAKKPKREWVGLTDEDLGFLFPHGKSVWLQETVKIIEAKLKEKNT